MTLLTFFNDPSSGPSNSVSLHSDFDQNQVIAGDTVELQVFPYSQNEDLVSKDAIVGATFTIKDPQGVATVHTGSIQDDASAFLRIHDSTTEGQYLWKVQFSFRDGQKRSFTGQFNSHDPLEINPQTRTHQIASKVWTRIEDCFDSELGGPWLRDETLASFEPSKIEKFIPEGLVYINGWPPLTNLSLVDFTTKIPSNDPVLPAGTLEEDPDQIIIVQATLLAVIKHLMRSYVEQPNPIGANIVYQNRRDYLERWNQIYQIEYQFFKEIVALWKRQFYNFGRGSLLVGHKAGRLGYGAGFRARNAARGVY